VRTSLACETVGAASNHPLQALQAHTLPLAHVLFSAMRLSPQALPALRALKQGSSRIGGAAECCSRVDGR
jgi:hypothetical protein